MTAPHHARTHELAAALEAMLDGIAHAHAQARDELGLSPLELRIMRVLRHGECTIGALARAADANRSSISMATRRLEQRELLTRTNDGRNTFVALSDESLRQLRDICCVPLERGIEQWLADATPDSGDERSAAALALARSIAAAYDHAIQERSDLATCDQLYRALRRGDASSAYDLALALVTNGRTRTAYEALAEAMHLVGDDWQRGEIGIAEERIATTACTRVVDRLHALVRSPGASPTRRALVLPAPGERHELPMKMLTNKLELLGWQVDLMLGDLPTAEVVSLCERVGFDAVFMGLTLDEHAAPAADLVRALAPHLQVVVGGQALTDPYVDGLIRSAGALVAPTLQDLEPAIARLAADAASAA